MFWHVILKQGRIVLKSGIQVQLCIWIEQKNVKDFIFYKYLCKMYILADI